VSDYGRRLVVCCIVALVVSVLTLAVRLPDGRKLGGREAYMAGTTAGLLALLALVLVGS
jgi:hypothetical protein